VARLEVAVVVRDAEGVPVWNYEHYEIIVPGEDSEETALRCLARVRTQIEECEERVTEQARRDLPHLAKEDEAMRRELEDAEKG
jgi:hypothetical protein